MILLIFVSLIYPDVPRELCPSMIFEAKSELVSWCPDLFPLDLDLSLLVFSLVMLRSSNLLDLLRPEKEKGFPAFVTSQPCLIQFSSLGRLVCRVPRMAPNVEVNLGGLLELGKSDLVLNEYLYLLGSFGP
ncbi:hypothetical protein Tco_0556871 [Tanacetum coccineum]